MLHKFFATLTAGLLLTTGAVESALADAQQDAIAKLQAAGAAIRRVAMDDDSIEVDFHLNGNKLTDDQLTPIKDLQKVVEVHLKDTQITDAALANLSGLATLKRLHLEQTKITDAALANLAPLAALEYLNLYNTGI